MRSLFKKLDQRLLPKNREMDGSLPYVTLIYLAFYCFPLFFQLPSFGETLLIVSALLVFLFLYFHLHWLPPRKRWRNLLFMWLLGISLSPWYSGGISFIIYAAAMSCLLENARKAALAILLIASATWLAGTLLNMNQSMLYTALFFVLMVGPMNIYLVDLGKKRRALDLSQQEIKTLAASAERERIARDLHDTMGHAFSMITLKAELAGKLIDKNLEAAKQQIKELEALSRDTLAQIRDAVTGYRRSGLRSELVNTKMALETAGFSFDSSFQSCELSEKLDDELALILRELTTNIIRHSNGSHCEVNIRQVNNTLTLEVTDDGNNASIEAGNGIAGIRERLHPFGGKLTITTGQQTRLLIQVSV